MYRSLWWAIVALLACCASFGLASGNVAGAIVLAFLVGGLSAAIYVRVDENHQGMAGHRRRLIAVGIGAGAITMLGSGLIDLLRGLGFVLLVLVVASSPICVSFICAKLGRPGSGVADPPEVRRGDGAAGVPPKAVPRARGRVPNVEGRPLPVPALPTAPDYRSCTLAELCQGWRHSFVELTKTSSPTRLIIVAQRQAYLDELERRDTTGFARWLDAGARAASDPGKYLRARTAKVPASVREADPEHVAGPERVAGDGPPLAIAHEMGRESSDMGQEQ